MADTRNVTDARAHESASYHGIGTSRRRMFDDERPLTRGQALGFGALTGSAITVVMLVLALAIGAAFGQWNEGMAYCLSFIVAGVAGGVLQQAWFSPNVALKLHYPARMAGFGFTYPIVLVGCAVLGAWMPTDSPVAWLEFLGTFIAIFAIISGLFAIRFRREGSTYSELLAAYRAKRENEVGNDHAAR